jgi:hypothetical protein
VQPNQKQSRGTQGQVQSAPMGFPNDCPLLYMPLFFSMTELPVDCCLSNGKPLNTSFMAGVPPIIPGFVGWSTAQALQHAMPGWFRLLMVCTELLCLPQPRPTDKRVASFQTTRLGSLTTTNHLQPSQPLPCTCLVWTQVVLLACGLACLQPDETCTHISFLPQTQARKTNAIPLSHIAQHSLCGPYTPPSPRKFFESWLVTLKHLWKLAAPCLPRALGKQGATCLPRALSKQVAACLPRTLDGQVATCSPRSPGERVAGVFPRALGKQVSYLLTESSW